MEKEKNNNETPLSSKNLFSRLFFVYAIKILKIGSKKYFRIFIFL